MRFDQLDARMRVFETADDHRVLPGIHIVVRLDGRGFTRLTREVCRFDAPFDERFRDLMLDTTEHVMDCGLRAIFGYTQSDEISLLLHPEEQSFGRKTRKLISILAGEASAKFSLQLGSIACFDARVCQLPRLEDVIDYFRWRGEDAHRNALNGHCYWALRRAGLDARDAARKLDGKSVADKTALLARAGSDFEALPRWQTRGAGVYFAWTESEATDRRTGEPVTVRRRRLTRDLELPRGEAYARFLEELVASKQTQASPLPEREGGTEGG